MLMRRVVTPTLALTAAAMAMLTGSTMATTMERAIVACLPLPLLRLLRAQQPAALVLEQPRNRSHHRQQEAAAASDRLTAASRPSAREIAPVAAAAAVVAVAVGAAVEAIVPG